MNIHTLWLTLVHDVLQVLNVDLGDMVATELGVLGMLVKVGRSFENSRNQFLQPVDLHFLTLVGDPWRHIAQILQLRRDDAHVLANRAGVDVVVSVPHLLDQIAQRFRRQDSIPIQGHQEAPAVVLVDDTGLVVLEVVQEATLTLTAEHRHVDLGVVLLVGQSQFEFLLEELFTHFLFGFLHAILNLGEVVLVRIQQPLDLRVKLVGVVTEHRVHVVHLVVVHVR